MTQTYQLIEAKISMDARVTHRKSRNNKKPGLLNSNSIQNARNRSTRGSGSGDFATARRVIELKNNLI